MTITSQTRSSRAGQGNVAHRGRRRAVALLLESLEVRQLLSGAQPTPDAPIERPTSTAAPIVSNEVSTARTPNQAATIDQANANLVDTGVAERSIASALATRSTSTGWLSFGRTTVYAISSSSLRDGTAGSSGGSISTGDDIVAIRVNSAASRFLAGLLAARGIDNVVISTPAFARSLTLLSTLSSRFSGPDDDRTTDNTVTVGASHSSSSTAAAPVILSSANIQVVVIAVGSGRVLFVLPLVTPTSSALAAASEPVQQKAQFVGDLPGPTPPLFDRFGQSELLSGLFGRRSRLAGDPEISGMIDLVTPVTGAAASPIQARVPERSADAVIGAAFTPWRWPLDLPGLAGSSIDVGGNVQASRKALDTDSAEERGAVEAQLDGLTPRLAAAGILAGAAYTMAIRESRSRGRGNLASQSRRFSPELRRQLLPGR